MYSDKLLFQASSAETPTALQQMVFKKEPGMCTRVCLNAFAYSPSLYHISRMEKPISRLMSPYLGETNKKMSASGITAEILTNLPRPFQELQMTPTYSGFCCIWRVRTAPAAENPE